MTGSERSDALQSIQALRALAGLAVVLFHLHGPTNWMGLPFPNFRLGAAGVDLFFVISGFVIVYASEPLFGQPRAPSRFFLRRCVRIVPLYWAVSAVLLAHILIRYDSLAAANNSIGTVVASFAFLPVPQLDGGVFPLVAVGWTLNYEMFFYALFAFAVMLPRSMAVISVAAVLAAIVAFGRIWAPLIQPFAFWSDPIVLEFVLGMVIALALRAGLKLSKSSRAMLLATAIIMFSLSTLSDWSENLRLLIWGLPAAMLVAAAALGPQPQRSAFWSAAAFMGDTSYALYLTHPFVLAPIRHSSPIIRVAPPLVVGAFFLLLSIAVAIAVYLAFDQPVSRLLKKALISRSRGPEILLQAPK